jgi:hypothetical protein
MCAYGFDFDWWWGKDKGPEHRDEPEKKAEKELSVDEEIKRRLDEMGDT